MENPQKSSKSFWIIIAIAVLVILGIVAFAVWGSDDDDDDDDKKDGDSSSSMVVSSVSSVSVSSASEESESSATTPTEADLSAFVGTYQGEGALLSSAIQFPEIEIIWSPENIASISASGFDTSVLGQEALMIDGTYPTIVANATAVASANDDGTVQLSVTTLDLGFELNGTVLPAAQASELLTAITASGLTIPTVTETEPLVTNATITPNNDGTVTIKGIDDVVLEFTGTPATAG